MDVRKLLWVLNRLNGFGIQKFKRLREELGDLVTLFEPETLNRLRLSPEWGEEFARSFQELMASDEFERELEHCSQNGIRLLSLLEDDYPKNLSSIYDPPLILYVKGALIPADEFAVAVVGSRHPTAYGLRTASRLASELAERGVTVISGFARGIDGEAHRGALRVKGRTIAVLGCGLDVIYPKEHRLLYGEIAEKGALVSEFPLGSQPLAFNFPKRNRIISGLSMGVLVVEAGQRSGSLITARLAAEEGREVYAVPGPVDSFVSGGTNQLIREGAKLVSCAEDILEDLAPQLRATLPSLQARHCEEPRPAEFGRIRPLAERGDEAISEPAIASAPLGTLSRNDGVHDPLLKLLSNQPLSFDEIAAGLDESPNLLRSRLTELELQGTVKRIFGGRYVRGK